MNFDLKSIFVLNTKGGEDRIIPMTERVFNLLSPMKKKKQNSLVFTNKDGNKIKHVPSTFARSVKKLGFNKDVTDKKMRVSWYTMRHTYASRLVQSGVNLYEVQQLLGHSTPVMTARYSKLAQSNLEAAVKSMETRKEIESQKDKTEGKIIPMQKQIS